MYNSVINVLICRYQGYIMLVY